MNVGNLTFGEKRELLELLGRSYDPNSKKWSGGRENLNGFDWNNLSNQEKRPFIKGLGKDNLRQMMPNALQDVGNRFVDAVDVLDGITEGPARQMQGGVKAVSRSMPNWLGGGKGSALTRFAGSRGVMNSLRAVPLLGGAAGVLGAVDVLAGDDSIGNKAMDTTAMGIGGVLGSVGGPMGVAAGAGLGKMTSDGLQWLFGDKKTAEQKQMAEALLALKGGTI